jgi:dTDP-4-dehydrorhamnose reductase
MVYTPHYPGSLQRPSALPRPPHRVRQSPAVDPPEVWAGVECTVNRVGEVYFDQMEWNGHARRLDDLDRFAALGIRALRYPVLWERTAPGDLADADWSWPDERLHRLRALGIRPIVGLVHHGSGPRHTALTDPAFPEKLAAYAGAVAARYPWVADYTPVNEPLTTARFSGLYGHWYPHGHDDATFLRILVNECRAVALAMHAIRAVNPNARLVQTEDMGATHSTPALAYQAAFENERRWLTYDLLCGRVRGGHRMWRYLTANGIAAEELAWFAENPCPPDIVGVNYYITSERFLDERLEGYPDWSIGGNGQDRYADVEAARAHAAQVAGPGALLSEAWRRYRLPIAVTEAHIGAACDDQLRWLHEIWTEACGLARAGVDLRAVTVWSLLGAYDWNRLVTKDRGFYEPGVFDVRAGTPEATPLAAMVRALATEGDHRHPALATPGWWRMPERLIYPASPAAASEDIAAG